jgi:hypothetical protein
MFHGHLDCFQKPSIGGRPNTRPGDHGTMNTHNRWFILFYHVQGPAWIEIHWNDVWLRAKSHMTSHYAWGSVTTLHDFGGVLGRPLDAILALTISWARLLAHVWSGPRCPWIFLGITGQDPSVPKSNWLHVDIFQIFFIKLGIFYKSSRLTNDFLDVLNVNRLFLIDIRRELSFPTRNTSTFPWVLSCANLTLVETLLKVEFHMKTTFKH